MAPSLLSEILGLTLKEQHSGISQNWKNGQNAEVKWPLLHNRVYFKFDASFENEIQQVIKTNIEVGELCFFDHYHAAFPSHAKM